MGTRLVLPCVGYEEMDGVPPAYRWLLKQSKLCIQRNLVSPMLSPQDGVPTP